MATKAKKKTKIEIEKNEDPQEDTVLMMAQDDDVPEVKIEDLPGVGQQLLKNYEKQDSMNYYH